MSHAWLDHPYDQTFMGVVIKQTWCDLVLWEHLFQQEKLTTVIELGTCYGGMSLFLLGQCLQRDIAFWTLDNDHEVTRSPVAEMLGLVSRCVRIDIFAEGTPWLEQHLGNPGLRPILLFCDNGNKPREVQTFTPLLQPGDILAVHDWPRVDGPADIHPADMVPVLGLLKPLLEKECEAMSSITRFWRRV